jgi:starch phosphorylase
VLQPLLELAHNFWWVWHAEAVELFRRLDRELWEVVYHNPVKLLGMISQQALAEAAKDEGFLAHLTRVHADFKRHLEEHGWYADTRTRGRLARGVLLRRVWVA